MIAAHLSVKKKSLHSGLITRLGTYRGNEFRCLTFLRRLGEVVQFVMMGALQNGIKTELTEGGHIKPLIWFNFKRNMLC